MKLQIKVDEELGKIVDAHFKTFVTAPPPPLLLPVVSNINNKKNRSNQEMPHVTGRTSFTQLAHSKEEIINRELDQIEIFEMSRRKKDGKWVNTAAEKCWENIQSEIHSASQATDVGESAHTREDIFIKVMGPNKPGRIRCAPRNETIKSYYGDTSSKTTLVSQRYEQAVQEATEAKKRCATMEEQLSKHQNCIDELVSTIQILVNKIQSDVP